MFYDKMYIILVEVVKLAQTINVSIRMDEQLKKQVDELLEDFGMNMTTAMLVFAKAIVRERKIPFEIYSASDDFYSPYNQKVLKEAIKRLDEGKGIVKTMAELEAMENE